MNPGYPDADRKLREVQEAAAAINRQIIIATAFWMIISRTLTRLDRLEHAPSDGLYAMVRLLARVIGVGIETADMLVPTFINS